MKKALRFLTAMILISGFSAEKSGYFFISKASAQSKTEDKAGPAPAADVTKKDEPEFIETNQKLPKPVKKEEGKFDDIRTAEERITNTRNVNVVSLTLGLEHDEVLPQLPKMIKFKGDFKTITDASYNIEKNTLRFAPKRDGKANISILDKNENVLMEFVIYVRKSGVDALSKEVEALLQDIEGIKVKIIDNVVVVDGQVLLARDFARVQNVVKLPQYLKSVASIVTISPLYYQKTAQILAKEINQYFPEVYVKSVNDYFIIGGEVNDESEKVKIFNIAKTYSPPVIIEDSESNIKKPKGDNKDSTGNVAIGYFVDFLKVKDRPAPPAPKTIQLIVHYVELAKDYQKAFTFKFAPSLSTNDQASGLKFNIGGTEDASQNFVGSITGIINNLLPKLQFLKSHGYARVLRSTSVITEEGKKGTVKSQSQLFVPISETSPTGGVIVTAKQVNTGIVTDLTPTITGESRDNISLDVKFSISSPAGAKGETNSNIVETYVSVRSGQSAAIGGLISNDSSTLFNDPNGIPNDPIFALYTSKKFQRKQSQFVVFVTPKILNSASENSVQVKKKFRLSEGQ